MSDEVIFKYGRREYPFKLTRLNRLEIRLWGHTYVGMVDIAKGEALIYAFRCPDHGLVVNYPKGHTERLECPICSRLRREARKRKPKTIESG